MSRYDALARMVKMFHDFFLPFLLKSGYLLCFHFQLYPRVIR